MLTALMKNTLASEGKNLNIMISHVAQLSTISNEQIF